MSEKHFGEKRSSFIGIHIQLKWNDIRTSSDMNELGDMLAEIKEVKL